MNKYDDLWTNTTHYHNLANISGPLTRNYPSYSGTELDPELNFPPDENYQNRLIAQMKNETQQIDVVMFRITSGKPPDEMIRRVKAGVPVRLITDRRQYRNTNVLLAFLQRRPDVPGGHPHQMERQRYRSGHAPEVGRAPRRGHGDLRFVQLDGIILGHVSASTITSRERPGSSTGSRNSFCESGTTPERTGRPSLRRSTSTTRLAGRTRR